ncbi:MAG: bifunctional glutamate N-acetyltransferase/amino-acid acetyltransferase ArgJ [Planctomycetes bacterium]|nr:bifunctional glutamate N-acetyltransferase/amino-acid acetyltransferase ArgJ [Planctomycetota bacterium]
MKDWKLPAGYRFAGVHCGIRPGGEAGRLDLAVVASDRPASAAGVFTCNRVVAAPVQVCRERLPSATTRGIVICSGNANACTGQRGLQDARRMTSLLAECLGCDEPQALVCSTGVIGRLLPMAEVEAGIRAAVPELTGTPEALERAARAILTTDTRIKVAARSVLLAGKEVRIAGFAKGAAMIGPNMATLLAFVLTDAAVKQDDLRMLAAAAADRSFHCISVEGHTSTNDTLLLLANGEGSPLQGDSLTVFAETVTEICAELARAIPADAEGASHLIEIRAEGLASDNDARQVARAVADSPLVKTAVFGADPNWGRIVSAAGYAGVAFEETQLSLWLDDFLLYKDGAPVPFDAAAVSAHMKSHRELQLRLVFRIGQGKCTFFTSDLTYDYVRINAEYTT